MTTDTTWQPPAPPQPPKRRRWLYALFGVVGLIIVLVILGAIFAPPTKPAATHPQASVPHTSAAAPAAPVAPAPSPNGTGQGTCDTSLSDQLYGQDYLTASVTVNNTGNVGEFVRVKVSWPQQGFAPITKHKVIKVPYGGTVTAQFNYPANTQQISNFQDAQLAATGDPCQYNLDFVSTYGTPSG